MKKSQKKRVSRTAKQAVKASRRHPKLFVTFFVLLVIVAILFGIYYWRFYRPKQEKPIPIQTGELSIHFLELGNKYTGDSILIKIDNTEVLVDGGSRENSAETIERYVKNYCTDGILEYVIVTHADQDHIAAFAGNKTFPSLFTKFECKMIIDFPKTNKSTVTYKNYVDEREREVEAGAVHYTALQCWNNSEGANRSYKLAENVTLNFLYNYYYDHASSDENNYSVCFTIQQGTNHYLFTGDLEEDGEKELVKYNTLPQCKLFKAGHHGSKTSSTDELLSVIRPEYVCVCCCAGSPEYTTNPENTFPTMQALNRILNYTDKIYVTSLAINVDLEKRSWDSTSFNGTIVVVSDGENFSVTGSAGSDPITSSEWFRENR